MTKPYDAAIKLRKSKKLPYPTYQEWLDFNLTIWGADGTDYLALSTHLLDTSASRPLAAYERQFLHNRLLRPQNTKWATVKSEDAVTRDIRNMYIVIDYEFLREIEGHSKSFCYQLLSEKWNISEVQIKRISS